MFEALHPGSSQFLTNLVREAGEVTESLLQEIGPFVNEQNATPLYFAVVCYTLDMHQFGVTSEQSFAFIINKLLQNRQKIDYRPLLTQAQSYLFFLFSVLENIKPLSEQAFYRGLPASSLSIIRECYATQGKIVCWPGLTSVSTSEDVAKAFAGKGGIVLRITSKSARGIHEFSLDPDEGEALLLPNFKAIICCPPLLKGGHWYVDVKEHPGNASRNAL